MPTILVDTATHDRLRLVAATLGVSESEAVAELLRRLAQTSTSPVASDSGKVPVHVVYKGTRVDAEFDPATEAVTILTDPLHGKTFNSPSRAAIEVVRLLNPDVHPNRNGWSFWLVSSTGAPLQAIRR